VKKTIPFPPPPEPIEDMLLRHTGEQLAAWRWKYRKPPKPKGLAPRPKIATMVTLEDDGSAEDEGTKW
jgi:hypothetical protein